MARVLDQSKPVFRFFEDLCEIPHGSGNERQISDFLMAFAKDRGLWAHQDKAMNVIIKKPASSGFEDAPAVMLQGHMDMVCEKNNDVVHDFLKDPLSLYIQDGWLRARGTTLGADDGCGVAIMLAILDDPDCRHPALECVFTVEEETGMAGAAALDYSLLRARRLVGLDSAGETSTVVSSAGGLRLRATRTLAYRPVPKDFTVCQLEIKGLEGGHSGIFIDKERGNSIKLAARVLHGLRTAGVDFYLADLRGGSKDNAIPRECVVSLAVQNAHLAKAETAAAGLAAEIGEELAASDAGFALTFGPSAAGADRMLAAGDTQAVVDLLFLMPNGVAAKSMTMQDLVLTSDNVGVVSIQDGCFQLLVSLRSAVESRIDELCARMTLLCDRLGFQWETGSRYPGMDYQTQSPFRDQYAAYMREVWGKELCLVAGHAGGEGGYFVKNLPGLELVALGPFIEDVHGPDERMDPVSFLRCYDFLVGFLARLG